MIGHHVDHGPTEEWKAGLFFLREIWPILRLEKIQKRPYFPKTKKAQFSAFVYIRAVQINAPLKTKVELLTIEPAIAMSFSPCFCRTPLL